MHPIERFTRRTGGDALREEGLAPLRRATHHISHADDEVGIEEVVGMSGFIEVIAKVAKLSLHYDDDFFDRLSHRYTLGVLVISTLIVSTKQYVGDPITCWCPATFLESHEEYTNNVCWISNTYYVPPEKNIPNVINQRREQELSYYQWVPFILLAMSALFYLPHCLWRLFTGRIGLDCSGIVYALNNAVHINPDARQKVIGYVVQHMDRYFDHQRDYRSGCCSRLQNFLADKCCLVWGKRYGNQIVTVYLLTKFVYIGNAIGQLFLMNIFLRTEYSFYGIEVIEKLINGTDWKESHRFPRITLCDFEIRRLGGMANTHRYTVQCALPVNLFNEKIFIFLWFWFVLVAFLSCWGILPWFMTLFQRTRVQYIKKYIKLANKHHGGEGKIYKAFTDKYLRQDGVFVLRIISKNTNDIVIAEIIVALWEHFKKHRRNFQPNGGPLHSAAEV